MLGAPALPSTRRLPASPPGAARWHPDGWEAMPAPPEKLSGPAADLWLSTGRRARQSLQSVLRLKIKLCKGGGGVRIQADAAGALRKGCLGFGQRESIAFSLCFLAGGGGLSYGSRWSTPGPRLSTVTGSSAGHGL